MNIVIRQAEIADMQSVSAILTEAALWLGKCGIPLWNVRDLSVECLNEDVAAGCYFLAEVEGQSAGTLRYALEDTVSWPDARDGESAFIHRVAVRRDYAGGTVSTALLKWAVDRTKALSRQYLRLDCEISRIKLRRFYERFGFQYHSDLHVGQYHVARYEYAIPEKKT
jgi:GNAT superfamily N-acetyltransferase